MKFTQHKYRWIAMDASGYWYAFVEKPEMYSNSGYWDDERNQYLVKWCKVVFKDFVPPPCDDWTQSLTEVEAE